jgi:hypothetical protein
MRCVGSTGALGWRAVLGLVVLVSGLACGTGHVAGPAIARTAETDAAVAGARAWLAVFATRDAERLIELTQLPFTFAGKFTGAEHLHRCDAMIGDTTRLERLIGCIDAQAPKLLPALGHAGELKLEPTDRTQLRTSVINLLGPARPGERLVQAVIGARWHYFELVLLLVPEENGSRTLVSAFVLGEQMVLH